jgi:hypothetical protein
VARDSRIIRVRNLELAELRTRTNAGAQGKMGRRKNRAERQRARQRLRRDGTLD